MIAKRNQVMRPYIRVLIAVIGILVVLSTLGTVKALQIRRMSEHDKQFVPPPQTVTFAQVK